jgi:ribulose 1,5-bisphosphate synthetase/thiazole synthase
MSSAAQKEKKSVQADVVVVGGGTAGFVAATAAARNGAKVILTEQQNFLGGTQTGGLVMMIRSMRHMQGPKDEEDKRTMHTSYESSYADQQLVFSIAQEFVDRMLDLNSAWGIKGQAATRQMFDPEMAKWVMEQMVKEAGVDLWYYSHVSDVLSAGRTVQGVAIENPHERTEINAKVTIDATGDGDVCAAAGAEFYLGDPKQGRCQPLTLYYMIGGVNLEKTYDYIRQNPGEFGLNYTERLLRMKSEGKPTMLSGFVKQAREATKNGDYPIAYGKTEPNPELLHFTYPMFKLGKFRDVTYHNMDMAYNVDPTDKRELTRATVAMRDMAVKMANFFRKYVPGYEDSYLLHTAELIGIRDSRRIIGEYTVTMEDALAGRAFEDGIGRYGSVMDVHDKEGTKSLLLTEVGGSGWFHIPFRTLLPRGTRGLLVAGRCISADHIVMGCTRSQAACMITGQAAGTAAAMASRLNVDPREVDISELQKTLAAQNQLI